MIRISAVQRNGTSSEVFKKIFKIYEQIGIGHVRYSTGGSYEYNTQPLLGFSKAKNSNHFIMET